MLQKYKELQKLIDRKRDIEIKIVKLNKDLYENVFSKTWNYEGKECYIDYVNPEHDKINLHHVEYRHSRANYTIKQMTFKEFVEYFDIK